MASEVLICNSALQLIKHSKIITSLEQDNKEANACELVYAELRDALLSMHNWNFATKRVQMARLSTAPPFEWQYGYQVPADFLRLTNVYSNSSGRGTVPYKIEGNELRSDAAEMYLRYVARIVDPNLMIPLFRIALSKLIASRLAVALSQSATRSDEMYSQFLDQDLPVAKSADSIQDLPDQLPESEWVSARHAVEQEDFFVVGVD